jgi:subtilisin family serine protease
MGVKCSCCVVAAVAMTWSPTAFAGRSVSVGYTTVSALHGLRVTKRVPALSTAQVRVPNLRAVQQLRRRPGIRFVQLERRRAETNAPSFTTAAALSVPEWQWSAAHEDLVPSWVQAAASSVTIAVVDTGADVTAPSIAAKHPTTYDVTKQSSTVDDAVGHGTFVASLAAGAVDDGAGMFGFGGAAQLMVVQANRGGTSFSDLDEASAIAWAVDHGARIVNLSIGGSQTSLTERGAIDYATSHGVLLVAAAGNSGQIGNPVMYPAALLGDAGLVVGAADAHGARAPFSTRGSYVDVLAPGVNVLGALASGIPAGFLTPADTPGAQGSYGFGSGTSYSAPEVAGAAALVWAANPSLDAEGVASTIEATASNAGVWTRDLAFGNIDIAGAVQRATNGPVAQVKRPTALPGPTLVKKAKARAAAKTPRR